MADFPLQFVISMATQTGMFIVWPKQPQGFWREGKNCFSLGLQLNWKTVSHEQTFEEDVFRSLQ